MFRFLLFILFVSVYHSGISAGNISDQDKINVSFDSEYLITDSSSSIAEVLERTDWKENSYAALRLNQSKSAIWLRFEIDNLSESEAYIQALCPYIDHFRLFQSIQGNWTEFSTIGDVYPFERRNVRESYPTQKVSLDSGKNTFLIKIYSSEDITFPMMVYPERAYVESRSTKVFLYGVYMGLMLIIIAFNLIMYFSVRHVVYLIYSLYLLVEALTQSALFGDPLTFLYGSNLFLSQYDVVICGSLLQVFGGEFFCSYFNLRRRTMVTIIIRLVQVFSLVALFIALFASISAAFDLLNILSLIASVTALVVSLRLAIEGSKLAQIFLVGWSVFLVGSIVFVIQTTGIIPYSVQGNYAMPVGTALEALILSFAVGYRMKILRETSRKKDDLIYKQLEINKKLAYEIEHSEIHYLQSQMNPHFLFNALNTIQNFIVNKDSRKATYYLGNVSGLLRTSLDILDGQLISLEKEIQFINDYLNAESLRFGRKLQFRIISDENMEPYDLLIPPYLIQPFVENSLKHAFRNSTEDPSIEIQFSEDEDNGRLIISITDNGCGMNQKKYLHSEEPRELKMMPSTEQWSDKTEGKQTVSY